MCKYQDIMFFHSQLASRVAMKYQYNDLKQRGHLNFEVCINDTDTEDSVSLPSLSIQTLCKKRRLIPTIPILIKFQFRLINSKIIGLELRRNEEWKILKIFFRTCMMTYCCVRSLGHHMMNWTWQFSVNYPA